MYFRCWYWQIYTRVCGKNKQAIELRLNIIHLLHLCILFTISFPLSIILHLASRPYFYILIWILFVICLKALYITINKWNEILSMWRTGSNPKFWTQFSYFNAPIKRNFVDSSKICKLCLITVLTLVSRWRAKYRTIPNVLLLFGQILSARNGII